MLSPFRFYLDTWASYKGSEDLAQGRQITEVRKYCHYLVRSRRESILTYLSYWRSELNALLAPFHHQLMPYQSGLSVDRIEQ